LHATVHINHASIHPLTSDNASVLQRFAGGVGMVVGMMCKNVYGCRVVGSVGSDEKVGKKGQCFHGLRLEIVL
jgi:NADPH-dependent curcumin reductase CurA